MQWLTLTLEAKSPFMTLPKGDTLFGQLCWHLRDLIGAEGVAKVLADYKAEPAFVVSDLLPAGQLPMPQVPLHWLGKTDLSTQQRKGIKKRRYIPYNLLSQPMTTWLELLAADESEEENPIRAVFQMHNSINRNTLTTDEQFTPFRLRKWQLSGALQLHICHDPQRIEAETLHKAVELMGLLGFGKRASTGHGRFIVKEIATRPHELADVRTWLTLAPSMPDVDTLNAQNTRYIPFTRWGRHGRELVHVMPFKAPVLMMDAGAVITLNTDWSQPWWGQALMNLSSKSVIDALGERPVHQGYTPILPVEVN